MMCYIAVFSPDDRIASKLLDIGYVIWIPLIELEPVRGSSMEAVEHLKKCPVAVIASPRTIEVLVEDAENLGLLNTLVETLKGNIIAVIGRSTAESISRYLKVEPHIVSPKPYTRDLVNHLKSRNYSCITLLKAESSATDIDELGEININVVTVYRYKVIEENLKILEKMVRDRGIDVLAVTSYTIANVLCRSSADIRDIPMVALGETTAKGIERSCGTKRNAVVVGDGTLEMFRYALKQVCSSVSRS